MIRKVRLPLKIKIIALVSTLLLGAISVFVLFALNLFQKDKSAYIHETTVMSTENLASQTNNYLKNTYNTLIKLATDPNKKLVTTSNNLLEFSIHHNQKRELTIINKKLLDLYAHPSTYFDIVRKHYSVPLRNIKSSKPFISNTTLPGELPHLFMAIKFKGKVYSVRFLLVDLIDTIKKNELYQSAIINKSGVLIIASDQKLNKYKSNIIKEIIESNIHIGSKEIKLEQKQKLLSFVELPLFNLYAFSLVDKEAVFEAARFLVQKSIFISLLVIAFAAIIGVIFSRGLTSHLEKLFQATLKIAQGDFSSRVEVKTSDEIGVLADSFNFMSSEITRYMKEMKEKVRVENELKVAKLVQDSFFPATNHELNNYDIAAFYTPATECGGDWWSYIEHNDKLIIFVADATGHGVPAAFLTATANCCSSNLKYLSKNSPELLNSPATILELMNHAVCNVAESILMTCFVCIIDPKNETISYSNASHNPPLLFHQKNDTPEKSDMHPLLKAKGPRLGHNINSTFEAAKEKISLNDQVILFTDGILESCNQESVQWGQRNFLNSLLKSINQGPENAVTEVIKELDAFRDGTPFDDDITFVVTRIKNGSGNNHFYPS